MARNPLAPFVILALLGCATARSQSAITADSATGAIAAGRIPGAGSPAARPDSVEIIAALLRANGASADRARLVAAPVLRHSRVERLDPLLVVGVIGVENPRLDLRARARDGSVGVMQVQPFWKREIRDCGQDLGDVDVNLCFGTRILRMAIDSSATLSQALWRYNGCRQRAACDRYAAAVFSRAGRAALIARDPGR